MIGIVRRIAVRALTLPGVMPMVQRWNRDLGIVFMLHRFADPDHGVRGGDPRLLRHALRLLRRHGFRIVAVDELIRWIRSPDRSPGPCVAFTLDDGYREQATVAAPIFAAFDAPATIFPVTGFVDGAGWMWWDRLTYLLETTDRPSASADRLWQDGNPVRLASAADRERAVMTGSRSMKRLSQDEREEALRELSEALDMALPDAPPPKYAPLTWDQARQCEAMGVRLGPHTVSHPTLSCESGERVRDEVVGSWMRLRQEVAEPVPVFCYPNGRRGDFGPRDTRILEQLGFEGALTAEPGYVAPVTVPAREGDPDDPSGSPFELPRYSFPRTYSSLVRIVSGLGGERRHGLSLHRREGGSPRGSSEGSWIQNPTTRKRAGSEPMRVADTGD